MKTKLTSVVHRIPITKARINLGQVVRRAHINKEYFILEKDGIPVAGLMAAEELEDYLELRDPKIRSQIRMSTEEYRQGKGRQASDFLAELVAQRTAKTKRGRHA